MITIISSLLGFGASFVPRIFSMIDGWQDRKHELSMLDRQMEMAKLQHGQRVEELNINADINETKAIYQHDRSLSNDGWIGALRGSVRPITTYLFLMLYLCVKGVSLYGIIWVDGVMVREAIPVIFIEYDAGILSCIISFWFGSRAMQKRVG